jgi:CrcB protein
MTRVLLVALGGALGSVLRYLATGGASALLGYEFPYGTLIVNLSGSFLIGVVQSLALEALLIPESARLFLSVGVMGGFTTYSAFSYDTVRLAEDGAWLAAWINVAATTVLCILLCALGMALGRLLITLRG